MAPNSSRQGPTLRSQTRDEESLNPIAIPATQSGTMEASQESEIGNEAGLSGTQERGQTGTQEVPTRPVSPAPIPNPDHSISGSMVGELLRQNRELMAALLNREQAPRSYTKKQTPKEPRTYEGRNLVELRAWRTDMETYFDNVDPREHPTGAEKVRYMRQFLSDHTRGLWDARMRSLTEPERNLAGPESIYSFFQGLWGNANNLAVREFRAYLSAQQREGQPIQKFANYVDTLLENMPERSEELKLMEMLAKI